MSDAQGERGWVPEFEGQRPPFEAGNAVGRQVGEGNDLAIQHGAYSPRKVEPLAAAFVQVLLEADSTPNHAKALVYRAELWATARAEAQIQLLTEWLMVKAEAAGDGIGDLGDERVRTAYLLLHRAEQRAASGRTRLGLTPLAAARLGKDVAQGAAANVDVALRMAQLHELEKQGWTPPSGWGEPAGGGES